MVVMVQVYLVQNLVLFEPETRMKLLMYSNIKQLKVKKIPGRGDRT